jgi:hypothetical protein
MTKAVPFLRLSPTVSLDPGENMPWLRIDPATSRSQVDHHHHCATCLKSRRTYLCAVMLVRVVMPSFL